MDEGWWRRIDAYCERGGPEFWAEPVNAVTNALFVLGALLAWRIWRREAPDDLAIPVLLALVVAIGVGSFLFHTFATAWAALADVLPITAFIVVYLVLTVRRFVGTAWWLALAAGVAFLPAAAFVERALSTLVGPALGGSEGYAPALLALLAFGAWLRRLGRPAGQALLVAAGLFFVSLTFRTLDQPLCAAWPLGTHFVWHGLNAVLLTWLVVTMVRHGGPAATRRVTGRPPGAGGVPAGRT